MRELSERIAARAAELPPAERRVAEVVLRDPSAAAFATVAQLADRADTSGATVVRLAERLGYDGWVDLQAQVRAGIDQQLRPATERIREPAPDDVVAATAAVETANVARTLDAVDRAAFRRAVALLADRKREVLVLAGASEAGIGTMAADALDLLRPGVGVLAGPPVAVARRLAHVARGDVVLALDLRRYERWVLDAARDATDRGCAVVAITDSAISPLAALATVAFTARAEGAGPFDSHVGTLALVNALAAGVARRLRTTATRRLDDVERAWRAAAALTD